MEAERNKSCVRSFRYIKVISFSHTRFAPRVRAEWNRRSPKQQPALTFLWKFSQARWLLLRGFYPALLCLLSRNFFASDKFSPMSYNNNNNGLPTITIWEEEVRLFAASSQTAKFLRHCQRNCGEERRDIHVLRE